MNDEDNKNNPKYERNSYNSFNMPKNTIVSKINTNNRIVTPNYEEISDQEVNEEEPALENNLVGENLLNQTPETDQVEPDNNTSSSGITNKIESIREKIKGTKQKIDKTKKTIKFIMKYKWIFIALIAFFLIMVIILFVLDPNMDNILSLTGWNNGVHDNTRTVQYTMEEINSLVIYIGDEDLNQIDSGVKTITSSNPNYNWMVSTAKNELENMISSAKFVVFKITNDDLNNASNYVNIFNSIKASHNDKVFYYVGNSDPSYANFNTTLKNGIGDSFINVGDDSDINVWHTNVVNYIQAHHFKTVDYSLETYPSSSESTELMGTPLSELLSQTDINALNSSIKEAAGSGCDKTSLVGVTISLINGLHKYGYHLPYYYGGGHNYEQIGIDPTWGMKTGGSSSGTKTYYYNGLDCSGLLTWGLHNIYVGGGGDTNTFMNVGFLINYSVAEPGDVIVNKNHMMLIIENNGSTIEVAEAAPSIGVGFKNYDINSLTSSYSVYDISSYLSSNCRR